MPGSIDEDSHPVPEWLTKGYLELALQKHFKDTSLTIANLDIQPATGKGENYASVMTRVVVDFKRDGDHGLQKGSYIVKTSYEGDQFATDIMKEYDVYNLEMRMYEKVLPALTEILLEIGDHDDMFAKTIAVDYDHSAIIFEDLRVRDFTMPDRVSGFDMDHVQMLLRKLAKMHATSAVMNERNPGIFKDCDRGLHNRHTKALSPIFLDNQEYCGRAVSKLDGCEKYGQKLLDMKPQLVENLRRVFDPIEDHFNVLAHGDIWINNVMCTYDDKKRPTDLIMIDFQFCVWGSPAIDLHYMFNTSLQEELRSQKQDELVQYYYEVLVKTLKALKFGGKIPTLFEFRRQMLEKSFYALSSTTLVQPVMTNEDSENADIHSLMGEGDGADKFKSCVYGNKKMLTKLQSMMPVFDRMGLLDPLES